MGLMNCTVSIQQEYAATKLPPDFSDLRI